MQINETINFLDKLHKVVLKILSAFLEKKMTTLFQIFHGKAGGIA